MLNFIIILYIYGLYYIKKTGGQDDLVTIWSFMEHRIISRCQGHKSWVKKIQLYK